MSPFSTIFCHCVKTFLNSPFSNRFSTERGYEHMWSIYQSQSFSEFTYHLLTKDLESKWRRHGVLSARGCKTILLHSGIESLVELTVDDT